MLSQEQQAIILEILAPFQPGKVGIFGSHARHEAHEKSDLDILVQFQKRYSLFDILEMEEQLSNAFHCKVDLITERSVHPAIKPYIERDIQYIA